MENKRNFAEILRQDKRVRFLLGGMVADGLVLITLVILAAALIAV